ncbi:MAG: nucleoside diphosphate kinase regulator [Kofleriaceae bacterium]
MRTVRDQIVITDHDLQRLQPLVDSAANESLEAELQRAIVVGRRQVSPDVVTMNSDVEYEDAVTGVRRKVRVVFPKDADPSRGWVSVLAPIGSALLGLRVGQQIEWKMPTGSKRITVVAIPYQPEAAGNFD